MKFIFNFVASMLWGYSLARQAGFCEWQARKALPPLTRSKWGTGASNGENPQAGGKPEHLLILEIQQLTQVAWDGRNFS